MTSRTPAAVRLWRSRKRRTRGDHAYLAYLVLMVAVVVVAPLVRAVGMGIASPPGIAVVTSSAAPGAATLAVAGLWAAALLTGRVRGPAVRAPFLTHVLASSDVSRIDGFGGPFLRAGSLATALTTVVAAAIGVSVVTAGRCEPGAAVTFVAAGACAGVIASVAWLVGQAMPRAAASVALLLFALAVITTAIPVLHPLAPWGWVGLAYPSAATAPEALVPLAALAAALVAAVPALMNRLTLARLTAHAARWEWAISHATGMEFADAASVYRPVPTLGRHLRAVRPARARLRVFLLRDAIGAARTPVRLCVGIAAVAVAGVLLAVALARGVSGGTAPGWIVGAVAGVVLFVGLGPLTDGIRHAASVAADLPLYGISDASLFVHHALFPFAVATLVLAAAALIVSLLIGQTVITGVLASTALGVLALMARVCGALKRPLPPALLAPIPTPFGDLGAAARLAWALDGLLLTAAAGASAAVMFSSPGLLPAVGVALAGLAIRRWRHRA